jgi:hypothetical protein
MLGFTPTQRVPTEGQYDALRKPTANDFNKATVLCNATARANSDLRLSMQRRSFVQGQAWPMTRLSRAASIAARFVA